MKLSLSAKFNVVFLAVFVLGFGATSLVTNYFLQQGAREETLQKARVLLAAADSASMYTSGQIGPLLESRMKFEFVPQSIPWFAASEQLNHLLKSYPEYTYKEATLNPTNPRDRASSWEAALVNDLRARPGTQELVGERAGTSGPALYVAKPIQIKDAACLACHSTPEAAPATMLDTYGHVNGFGWKFNEIIGAQVISVPMALPLRRAADTLRTYMLSMVGVFVFLFCALNVGVHQFVTRRLRHMSALADRVSLGDFAVGELNMQGSDELSRLARSFGRMRTSLASAMKMLED
jgi:HAMP domain-containing protein